MAKRPKNWTPDPLKDREAAKKTKGFRVKARVKVNKEVPKLEVSPNWYQEFADFQKLVWQTDGTSVVEEKPKDPLKDFTEDWYEKNKDSV